MTPRPLDPPEPSFEGALHLALSGRHADAIQAILRATSEGASETHVAVAAAALSQVARLAASAGDAAQAERALAAALRWRPRHADLHFQRAAALLALGRAAEARGALDQALEINPRYAAARLERALLDAREGRLGEALESVRMLSSEVAVQEPRAFQQGLASLERAEWEEAGELFKRSLRIGDPEVQGLVERAQALLRDGDTPAAARVLREALGRRPAYPDLHALLGTAEARLGHLDDAVASLSRALELNPDYHDARLELARALEGLGLRAQALDQLALVVERLPDHPAALELQARWGPRRGAPARDARRA